MSHRSEHAAILHLLDDIEATTGCAAQLCREELKEVWGI